MGFRVALRCRVLPYLLLSGDEDDNQLLLSYDVQPHISNPGHDTFACCAHTGISSQVVHMPQRRDRSFSRWYTMKQSQAQSLETLVTRILE